MNTPEILLTYTGNILDAQVVLPSSKSISNRVLIIQALTNFSFHIENISTAEDTQLLQNILQQNSSSIYTGDGGTTFRFLLAYLCTLHRTFDLSGSPQFNRRPIAPLVKALQKLGADIRYTQKDGFAPVQIFPSSLKGGDVYVDASVSSQFISALMLIGPTLPNGLRIHLSKDVVSASYIQMTAAVMNELGVDVYLNERVVEILPKPYQSKTFSVEPDWSSAAFWYQWIAMLPPGNKVFFKGLKKTGIQGDEHAWLIFSWLGVNSIDTNDGILIFKSSDELLHDFSEPIDLKNSPDLAPAFIAALAARRIKTKIIGLQTLMIKESNRIQALQSELAKLGVITSAGSNWLSLDDYVMNYKKHIPLFNSYDDHRIAMAMAPFSIMYPGIRLSNPYVVKKSYPAYWEQLQQVGLIQINTI
ncbi:MAG: hypothetical protein N2167_04275 [Flavobacteriales bacterium]|nr:hypothetical protein [Flavobacteriales bacterium]